MGSHLDSARRNRYGDQTVQRVRPAEVVIFFAALFVWGVVSYEAGKRDGLREAQVVHTPAAVKHALLQRSLGGEWVPVGPDMDCRRDAGSLSVRLFGKEEVVLTDNVARWSAPPPPPEWWPPPEPTTVALTE